MSRRTWVPAADIKESENEILFTLEVPGLEQKDIKISVEEGVLTFSGEKTSQKTEGNDHFHSERWHGEFTRSFRLPDSSDVEKISASLKNGILTVSVPKKEEARPRQVEVKID